MSKLSTVRYSIIPTNYRTRSDWSVEEQQKLVHAMSCVRRLSGHLQMELGEDSLSCNVRVQKCNHEPETTEEG